MFYDECPGPYIILRDFAASLGATIMKTLNQNEVPSGKAHIAWNIAQSIGKSQTDCSLQLYKWNETAAIKKKLIQAGSYLLEIKKDLISLIWAWIRSSNLNRLESNQQKLSYWLNKYERVRKY